MVTPIGVSHRVFATADNPPKDFQHYPEKTLLTHTDLDGGEARIDLIHYERNRVVFFEATVSNYRGTKITKLEDPDNLQQLILDKVKKWLGKDVYNVEVTGKEAAGQQLQAAPKKLSVTYRARSNFARPASPEIHYVVTTTCPILKLQQSRIEKYNWIEVCHLEDLIEMDVFEEDMKKQILEKQATDANGEGG